MGLLESRGFEFDNVIVCSANEGVLPSNSFIILYCRLISRKNSICLILSMMMLELVMISIIYYKEHQKFIWYIIVYQKG